jgi:PAS domain S-box-containing protein
MHDRTLGAVLTAFTLTIFLLLLSTWACVRILSGVRAYVGGEGLYSKSQKNAVYYLELYVQTRQEHWFAQFQQSLRVPEGDRDARIELQRNNPHREIVARGFVSGGNSPEDVDDLIFVFRRMGRTPYVRAAVEIWTQGDAEIAALRRLGDRIHARLSSDNALSTENAIVEIEASNRRLTNLEDRFSSTLGAGARFSGKALLFAIGFLAVGLWVFGTLTFRRLLSAFALERENLRAIIHNAPTGIVLVEAPHGRVRMCNAQAWQILHQDREHAAGPDTDAKLAERWREKGLEKLIRESSDHPIARALAGDVVRARDMRWSREDSAEVWLRVSAAPIWRRGRIAGAVAIFNDISEERKIEEAMVRQSEELARSNADLEQFAYTTSHDLQEPLRNIAIFSQLLERDYGNKLAPGADHLLEVITSSVARMSALIHDLLAYSRINNGDAAPMKAVMLSQAVDWACSSLRSKILESGTVIDVATLPAVRGDQVQLVQVFQNLIENAIKYAGEARPEIRITARRTAGALQGEWEITVRDNGVGIDGRYHQQIFGIFKRLHGRDVPGTGIGLALTRKVVERHGGRIRVESETGRGAAFIFTLRGVETAQTTEVPDYRRTTIQ